MTAEPFSETFVRNPYPTYSRLRADGPVIPVPLPSGGRAWLVTRYDDVRRGLSDPRLSNVQARLNVPAPFDVLPLELRPAVISDLLNVDDPDHARLRTLIAPAFSATAAEAFRPRLEALADNLISALAGRETADLVDEFATPFAVRSLAEVLGVSAESHGQFQQVASAVVAAIHGRDPDQLLAPALAQHAYIEQLLADVRKRPRIGLLSRLVRAHNKGELSRHELTSVVFGLLIAGQEGTANLIGTGLYLLLTHPDQLSRLRTDTTLLGTAVDEFARYEAPLDLTIFRSYHQELQFSGVTVPPGEPLMFSLGSAGRDGTQFRCPDQLDIGRANNPHLSFGRGRHYCPGASLGRVQVQVAINKLMARFPRLELAVPADQVPWRPTVITRGTSALPVRLV
jgi:cytochrome P450